jgi:hypothetical protein
MSAIFTIPNGTAISQSLQLKGGIPHGIIMPAAWTAAAIGFSISEDDVTYVPVFIEAGTELTLATAASQYLALTHGFFARMPSHLYVKLRSGTVAVAVNQGAARTLTMLLGQPVV